MDQDDVSHTMLIACQKGDADMVLNLLNAGADVNFRAGNQEAGALHAAAQEGHVECARVVLDNGADIELYTGKKGMTALMVAALHNKTDIVKLLLERGACPNTTRRGGRATALNMAAGEGNFDIVEMLISHGADLEPKLRDNTTPLMLASLKGFVDIVQYMIIQGADVNARDDDGVRPLHCAAQRGHYAVVEALVLNGADVDAYTNNGTTPLLYAIPKHSYEIAKFLLKHGADPNVNRPIDDCTPLAAAAQSGNVLIMELLLEHGVHIETASGEALMMAALKGNSEVMSWLLKHGADINTIGKKGVTVLHCAAQKGADECIQLSLEKEADPNAKTFDDNTTPLMMAALNGHTKIVERLLNAGANVNDADDKFITALHCAAQNGHAECADVLLKNGANPEARTRGSMTPFMIAVSRGQTEVLGVLNKYGVTHTAGFVATNKITDGQDIGRYYSQAMPTNRGDAHEMKNVSEKPERISYEKIPNANIGKTSLSSIDKILRLHQHSLYTEPIVECGMTTHSVKTTPVEESREGDATLVEKTSLEKAIISHAEELERHIDVPEVESRLKELRVMDPTHSCLDVKSMLDSLATGSRDDWAKVFMSLLESKSDYADVTESISKASKE